MKKLLFIVIITVFAVNDTNAQLTNGATAPDFTFTDLNGNTQNLYSYLNVGKYVAIDVFTTWCSPCWAYNNLRTMDSLYTMHDIPGDNTWKVLGIEADGGTDSADMYGTGTSTQGNWVTGTLYPLMNPPSGIGLNDFKTGYNITFYPTLYLICPNKKVYQDTLNTGVKPPVSRWQYVADHFCSGAGLDDIKDADPVTIFPNPSKDHVTLYFTLNNGADIKLSVSNIMGQLVETKSFNNLSAGDQAFKVDVSEYKKGIYFFTVSDNNGRFVRKKVVVQ